MHIVHYLQRIWIRDGGVVRAVLDLCSGMANAGHDVTLITCDDQDAPEPWKRAEPGQPRVVRIDPPGPLGGLLGASTRRQIRPYLQSADVLHLHVLWDPMQLAFAAVARELGKPYIQTPHGMLAEWSMQQKAPKKWVYYRTAGAKLLRDAAFVHCTAQGELDQARKWFRPDQGRVVPLIFDLTPYLTLPGPEAARARLSLPAPDMPTAIYLSRLHVKKRPDLFVRAAKPLKDRGLRFHFVVGGPAEPEYEAQVKQIATDLDVTDRVTFLGMVPQELKTSLYQACDLFCLPTSMENFGFVYFEALASTTAVLTTKGTDTWRELEESGGGVTVDQIDKPGALDQLVDRLGELLKDQQNLARMGQSGRRWTLENLDPAVISRRYEALYADAAASRHGAPAPAGTP